MEDRSDEIRSRRTHTAGLLLAVALLMLPGCEGEETVDTAAPIASDQEETVDPTDPIASGRATYEEFCASCHGLDARGNGPVAEILTVQPADLTQLRQQHDGNFPVDEIYQVIDGREDVPAHGTREMPIWGNIWDMEEGRPVSEETIQRRINELIEYLRTIQEERSAG